MATKIESTEITQQKKVYVKSEEALDEMEANGQLEPFTEYYTDDEETDVSKTIEFAESERQKSKNLFDIDKYLSLIRSSNQSTYSIDYNNQALNITPNNTSDPYVSSNYSLKLKPNTTYTISYNITGGTYLQFYYHDGSSWINTTKSFTTNSDGIVNSFRIDIAEGTVGTTYTISHIMLEEGGEITEYQPYNGEITHTKEINTNMLGVPSNDNWIDITWSGITMFYTAPANGYIVAYFESTSNSPNDAFRGVRIYNAGNNSFPDGYATSVIKGGACCMLHTTLTAGDFQVSTPVKKGDYLRIISQNINHRALRFIPSEEV